MAKTIYIGYNRRSCVTGKSLFDELKRISPADYSFRRFCNQEPKKEPDVLIRWGNSLVNSPNTTKEINNQEAVRKTTDKLEMIKALKAIDGVRIPDVALASDTISLSRAASTVSDADRHVFVRDANDHVRYCNVSEITARDKYALRPLTKAREFRIHIFDGKTIGVYEKRPHNPGDPIWKNNNTDFVRLNQADGGVMGRLKGVRPMCKAAVSGLGLVFGGVDVIEDSQGTFYINEVNSSPALNEPNVRRWSQHLLEYIQNLEEINHTADQSRQALDERNAARLAEQQRLQQEEAAAQHARVIAARTAAAEDVKRRMREIAEAEGFTARVTLTDTTI